MSGELLSTLSRPCLHRPRRHPAPPDVVCVPEVCAFVVSMLREIADYPIDGLCLLYNRRPPLVEYEPPLVEGFKARYGKDPHQLDERDPEWLAYRAATLTQFMRELRAGLNQRRGPRLEISAIVAGTEAENLYYAMDLREWVRQELVDTIIPYTSAPKLLSRADSWVDPSSARFFFDLTRGTRCKLAFNLMPRDLRRPSIAAGRTACIRREPNTFFSGTVGSVLASMPRAWDIAKRLPDGWPPESRRSRCRRYG